MIGEGMFYDSGVGSLTLPDSVTEIGLSAFENCSFLKSVNIPAGVTGIGRLAFSGCKALTSLTLPEGLVSIGDNTFENCSKLTLTVTPGSYAEQFAKKHALSYTCQSNTDWLN